MKVTIIGGAGGMGRWFAGFFKENGVEVWIVDKSDKTEEIAKEMNVQFLNADILKVTEGEVERKEDVVDTDVLLVSVPIDITGRVIEHMGPKMHKGSLLMDITSVKKMPVGMMEKFTNEGVEILGTHPLFGPTTKSMQGQTIIFMPLRKGHFYERIYEMFERNGARIEILTAEEHDEIMSVIQGLTHFILISFGITLKNLDFDVEKSRKFMSPMYEILMDFVGRLLHQDPHLYAMIQTNFEMGKLHESFLTVANRLYELVSAGKVDEFIEEMREAKKHFGNTERAMIDSDRVIEEKINQNLFLERKGLPNKLSLEKKV
ncbi:MAG: prephenate dehydrogenase/arogenate dehydrogenase family protein [Methanophagales archaeon]|nr:prephenate dehydrogenase/arogenate dehydrogenase family protein [Methanophagales archaeon]